MVRQVHRLPPLLLPPVFLPPGQGRSPVKVLVQRRPRHAIPLCDVGDGDGLGVVERLDFPPFLVTDLGLAPTRPTAASEVDARNPRRVVRALEVALLGADAQVTLPQAPKLWHDHNRVLGVSCERATLVKRLDARVEEMWASGLVAEARDLVPLGMCIGPFSLMTKNETAS